MSWVEDLLEETIARLRLQTAGDGNFFGEYRGHPIVLKVMEDEPHIWFLKVRHGTLADDATIDESDTPWEAQELIGFSWDSDEYVWIDFNDVSEFVDTDPIVKSLDRVTAFLHERALGVTPQCVACDTQADIEVTYSNECAGWICTDCFEQRLTEAARVPADRRHPLRLLFVVFGVALSAAVWALVWTGYNWVFDLLDVRTLYLPTFLLVLVFGAVSLLAAFPVILSVEMSPTVALLPDKIVMPVLAAIGLALGEWLDLTIQVRIQFDTWAPGTVYEFFWELVETYSWMYAGMKILTAFGVIAICFAFAKKREGMKI